MAGARARATRHLLANGDHMVQGWWWATRHPSAAVGGRLVSLQSYFGMSSDVSEPLTTPAAGAGHGPAHVGACEQGGQACT